MIRAVAVGLCLCSNFKVLNCALGRSKSNKMAVNDCNPTIILDVFQREKCREQRKEDKQEPKRDQIPEEIPQEENNQLNSIKKRRSGSTLRRSFGLTFRAACNAIDPSLPPCEKKRRVAELCLNQTLADLKSNALESEYDSVILFSENLREKMQDILQKVQNSGDKITAQKQETKLQTHIMQIKEEKTKWNVEYQKRREAYMEARNKLKDVLKGNGHIENARLKSEDLKFLKGLPDFGAVNKRIVTYKNRHCLGLIQLEKNANRVYDSLTKVERQLDEFKCAVAPSFQWGC